MPTRSTRSLIPTPEDCVIDRGRESDESPQNRVDLDQPKRSALLMTVEELHSTTHN